MAKVEGLIAEVPNLLEDKQAAVRYEHDSDTGENRFFNIRGQEIPEEEYLRGWGVAVPESIGDNPELSRLRSRNRELEDRVSQLETEKTEWQRQNDGLNSRLDEMERRLGISDPAGTTVSSAEPYRPPVPPEPVRQHRLVGPLGEKLTRRSVKTEGGRYYVRRPGRSWIQVDEFAAAEMARDDDRAGFMVLGGVALAGLGLLAGYLIWGRHTGQNVNLAEHWQAFGPRGMKGALVPENIDIVKSNGHDVFVNSQGHTLISAQEMPRGIADYKGVFSKAARAALRARGLAVDYIKAGRGVHGWHYMSVVTEKPR